MSELKWPVAAAVAAMLTLSGGVAYAAPGSHPAHTGNTSLLSGNRALLSLSVPVTVCGVALAALGTAEASCQGGADVRSTGVPGSLATNAGNTSAGSKNGVTAPISIPVNVCGVSVAIFGTAVSGCQGGASVTNLPAAPPSGDTHGNHGSSGCGKHSCGKHDCGKHSCGKRRGGKSGRHHGGKRGCAAKHGKSCGHSGGKHGRHHGGKPSTPGGHHGGSTTSHHGGSTTSTKKHQPTAPARTSAKYAPVTTTTRSVASSLLPTTGADVVALLVGALGSLAVGTAALLTGRRRRAGSSA
jgi:hypothetical protein